jgi:hypothetical protein
VFRLTGGLNSKDANYLSTEPRCIGVRGSANAGMGRSRYRGQLWSLLRARVYALASPPPRSLSSSRSTVLPTLSSSWPQPFEHYFLTDRHKDSDSYTSITAEDDLAEIRQAVQSADTADLYQVQ